MTKILSFLALVLLLPSLASVMRVDDPKGRPMVRVNTAVAQRDPGRIKLLVIPQSVSLPTKTISGKWLLATRSTTRRSRRCWRSETLIIRS